MASNIVVPDTLIALSSDSLNQQRQHADAAHQRAILIFSAASILLTVVPALSGGFDQSQLAHWAVLGAASAAYLLTVACCLFAYWPRDMKVSLQPGALLESYRDIDTDAGRQAYLENLEKCYQVNDSALRWKYRWLTWALPWLAVETLSLLVAMVVFSVGGG